MKQKLSLGGSISLLTGGVIAVLALVRGKWMVPLLLTVFALWGLWIILGLLLPSWRSNQMYRRKEQRARKDRDALANTSFSNADMSQALLCHVNYRISDHLKASYPNVRWEWTMPQPSRFVAEGGTGRIRLYGVPDFEYADVRLGRNGELTCSLVKIVPVDGQPAAQASDPQVWYELQGRKVLERLIADLLSRGHSSLTLKEDGRICIKPMDGGEDVAQEKFTSFPEKANWPDLAKVLEKEGLAAVMQDDGIAVAW